jgi:hypothetical protein
VAETKVAEQPEFSGTLEQVCHALTQDPRFAINGGVMEDEETKACAVGQSAADSHPVARFVAQTRVSATATSPAIRFYQIKVWRTQPDAFGAVAEEKSLAVTNNAVVWSKASSGTPETHPMASMVPPAS